jgi:hypothetical protein
VARFDGFRKGTSPAAGLCLRQAQDAAFDAFGTASNASRGEQHASVEVTAIDLNVCCLQQPRDCAHVFPATFEMIGKHHRVLLPRTLQPVAREGVPGDAIYIRKHAVRRLSQQAMPKFVLALPG